MRRAGSLQRTRDALPPRAWVSPALAETLGVKQGEHVLSWLPNGPAAVLNWLALNLLGAIYVPINTAYKGRLLQHVIVVLLPLAAVAALLVALWTWYRHHLGVATLVATFLVTLCVPLTTQSGESLASRLPKSEVIATHVADGDRVQWVAALFGLCLFAVVALDLRRRASAPADLAPAEVWVSRRAPAHWRNEAPTWTSPALTIARVLLSPTINKGASDTLTLTWNHDVLGA